MPWHASVELCARIAHWSPRADLPALALTSKAFLQATRPVLYAAVHLATPQRTLAACQTIVDSPLLGAHVRSFAVYQHQHQHHQHQHHPRRVGAWPRALWTLVARALEHMPNLETMVMVDPVCENTWVLDGVKSTVVKEIKVKLCWDQALVDFLMRQKHLWYMQYADAPEDEQRPRVVPGSIPAFRVFEGPITVAADLVPSCHLSHLQVFIEEESIPFLFEFLALFSFKPGQYLRGLNVLDIPERMVSDAVRIIANSCPNLRHLGVLPYPAHSRHDLHRQLCALPLHSLEIALDSHQWALPSYRPPSHRHRQRQQQAGHALAPMIQRILVTELKTYCATLTAVVLWIAGRRSVWRLFEGPPAHEAQQPCDAAVPAGPVGDVWKMCTEWEGGWSSA